MSSSGIARACNEDVQTGELDEASSGVETRDMRRPKSTTPKASTASAPVSNNNTHTRTFADDIEDVVALGIMGNVFDDFDVGRRSPSNNASRDDDRTLCRVCREDVLSNQVTTELPSSAPPAIRLSIKKKKFCTSCKNYLDIETCFLENRRTCMACLKKHKLYERRRRRRRKASV